MGEGLIVRRGGSSGGKAEFQYVWKKYKVTTGTFTNATISWKSKLTSSKILTLTCTSNDVDVNTIDPKFFVDKNVAGNGTNKSNWWFYENGSLLIENYSGTVREACNGEWTYKDGILTATIINTSTKKTSTIYATASSGTYSGSGTTTKKEYEGLVTDSDGYKYPDGGIVNGYYYERYSMNSIACACVHSEIITVANSQNYIFTIPLDFTPTHIQFASTKKCTIVSSDITEIISLPSGLLNLTVPEAGTIMGKECWINYVIRAVENGLQIQIIPAIKYAGWYVSLTKIEIADLYIFKLA